MDYRKYKLSIPLLKIFTEIYETEEAFFDLWRFLAKDDILLEAVVYFSKVIDKN